MPTIIKTLISSFIIISFSINSNANTIEDIISKIETNLSVAVVFDTITKVSWSSITYENCNDSVETLKYLTLLDKEYSKYPKSFFQLVGIKTIILALQLKFLDQYRAAIPDPYSNSLFLSIDGQGGVYSTEYLIHVMHHELNHCTEYAIWKNMNYEWGEWGKLNHLLFKYKGGGELAYKNNSVNWYPVTHPKKGFLNLYSTTAQEEDRSELIALIMNDEERKYIFQYYASDRILRKKINILLNQLNTFSNTSENFWQNNLSRLVKK